MSLLKSVNWEFVGPLVLGIGVGGAVSLGLWGPGGASQGGALSGFAAVTLVGLAVVYRHEFTGSGRADHRPTAER